MPAFTGESAGLLMAAEPRPSPAIEPGRLSAAAAEFYLQVYRPARAGSLNALRKVGCGEEEAEEIFAATFEHVMRTVDPIARSFEVPQMVNFIKRSAWRTLIDERRRRGQRTEIELNAVHSLSDDGAEGPDELAEEREAVAIGREALQMLPERDRMIFRQRHEMDLSPEEILERTPGLSLRTYRKIIQRANSRVLAAFERIEDGGRCEEMESDLLRRYVAEACGEAEQAQVEIHLAHCRHCQIAHARMRGRLFDVAGGLSAIAGSASAGTRGHLGHLVDTLSRILDARHGLVAGTRSVRERVRDQSLRVATSVPGSGGDAAAGQFIGASTIKVAAGCLTGAAATTAACVALGVGPFAAAGVIHHPARPKPVVRKAERHQARPVVVSPPAREEETVEASEEPVNTPQPQPQPAKPKREKATAESSAHQKVTKPETVQPASASGGELVEGLEGAGTPAAEAEPAPTTNESDPAASSSSVSPESSGSGAGTSGSGGGGGAGKGAGAPVDGGAELGL